MTPHEISETIQNCLSKGLEERIGKHHIEEALDSLVPLLGIVPHLEKEVKLEITLQTYYEDRFDMMGTQGWQDFIEDVQALFTTYNGINSIETFEEFQKRKGQVDILQWLLSLKDVSEQSYEELLIEDTN